MFYDLADMAVGCKGNITFVENGHNTHSFEGEFIKCDFNKQTLTLKHSVFGTEFECDIHIPDILSVKFITKDVMENNFYLKVCDYLYVEITVNSVIYV